MTFLRVVFLFNVVHTKMRDAVEAKSDEVGEYSMERRRDKTV